MDFFKDDHTKQFSFARISAGVAFAALMVYCGYAVYKTSSLPDLPTGWLQYILGSYGLNKLSSTVKEVKNVANAPVE